jgi:hypothetical protein
VRFAGEAWTRPQSDAAEAVDGILGIGVVNQPLPPLPDLSRSVGRGKLVTLKIRVSGPIFVRSEPVSWFETWLGKCGRS